MEVNVYTDLRIYYLRQKNGSKYEFRLSTSSQVELTEIF